MVDATARAVDPAPVAKPTSTILALERPETYPGRVRNVEVVETHMSWVFLTEEHAYKLKKPIRTALLDYTTLEARRRACDAEVELNRRLASSVYLGVVPLASSGNGPRVEGLGVPCDWLVKMRRLPRDRMLDACIANRSVEPEDIDRFVATMLAFYASAEPAPIAGPAYLARIASDIVAKAAAMKAPRYALVGADIDAVVDGLRCWLERHAARLESRATRVVDAHGDLRPEHICLEPRPVIIDCLEFKRELRLLDPVSELSFLSLECRRLDAAWIGERIFDACAENSGERPSRALVDFYQSYHALVRAAVAVWHLDDLTVVPAEKWRVRACNYLALAKATTSAQMLLHE